MNRIHPSSATLGRCLVRTRLEPTLAALLAVALGGTAACGEDGGGPSVGFVMPADPSAPLVVAEHPFPSDAFRGADGRIAMPAASLPFGPNAEAEAVEAMARAFEDRDCFGPTAGVVFPLVDLEVGEELDVATLADRVELIDLADGTVLPVETHVRTFEDQLYVRAARGRILAPGVAHAVVLRRGIATTAGRALVQPDDLGAALAGDGAPRLERAVRALAPLADRLGDDAGDVVGATVFTVCDDAGELEAAREIVWSGAAPALTVDRVVHRAEELDALLGRPVAQRPGADNPGGIAHDTIGYVIQGHFPSPNFQSAVPGVVGAWEVVDGAPIVKGYDDVPVVIVLPAGVGGYADLPVVTFQHGINGNKATVFDVANTMTARGYAVVGIDIPFHGDRRPGASDVRHNKSSTPGPDGFADDSGFASAMLLFDISPNDEAVAAFDPRVMADGLRQSAVDLMALARFLVEGDLSAAGADAGALVGLSFDAERVVYCAESFGSILGLLALAFEPAYQAAFLSVGGGAILTDFLENSPVYSLAFLPLIGSAFDVEPNEVDPAFDPAHTHQAHQLLGMLVDRGDPISYARRIVASGTHLALALAYDDESVPNQASEAEAAALGLEWVRLAGTTAGPRFVEAALLPVVDGPVTGNLAVGEAPVTAAVAMFEVATHGMMTQQRGEWMFEGGFPPFVGRQPPLEVENPIERLQTLMADFADSYRANGVPTFGDALP